MMSPVIHRCEMRCANGGRLRILSARMDDRPSLHNSDLIWIQQLPGGQIDSHEFAIKDMPRALGPEGVFAVVLQQIATNDAPAHDDAGAIVPLPEKTPEEWRQVAGLHLQFARLALEKAGLAPIEREPERSLFDEHQRLIRLTGGAT